MSNDDCFFSPLSFVLNLILFWSQECCLHYEVIHSMSSNDKGTPASYHSETGKINTPHQVFSDRHSIKSLFYLRPASPKKKWLCGSVFEKYMFGVL